MAEPRLKTCTMNTNNGQTRIALLAESGVTYAIRFAFDSVSKSERFAESARGVLGLLVGQRIYLNNQNQVSTVGFFNPRALAKSFQEGQA